MMTSPLQDRFQQTRRRAALQTVSQHQANIGRVYRVCWDKMLGLRGYIIPGVAIYELIIMIK